MSTATATKKKGTRCSLPAYPNQREATLAAKELASWAKAPTAPVLCNRGRHWHVVVKWPIAQRAS